MFSLISSNYKEKTYFISEKLHLDDHIETSWKQRLQVKFSKIIYIYSMYLKPVYIYLIYLSKYIQWISNLGVFVDFYMEYFGIMKIYILI